MIDLPIDAIRNHRPIRTHTHTTDMCIAPYDSQIKCIQLCELNWHFYLEFKVFVYCKIESIFVCWFDGYCFETSTTPQYPTKRKKKKKNNLVLISWNSVIGFGVIFFLVIEIKCKMHKKIENFKTCNMHLQSCWYEISWKFLTREKGADT